MGRRRDFAAAAATSILSRKSSRTINNGSSKNGSSSSSGSSKNPFHGRGMDKFQQVYVELETMRATIAAREGVPTTDIWFMRGTSGDWVPVVVGKKLRNEINEQGIEEAIESKGIVHQQADEQQEPVPASYSSSFLSWLAIRLEQFILDLQQGARRTLKAVTIFIMVFAAVADVVVAMAAEFAAKFQTSLARCCGTVRIESPPSDLVRCQPLDLQDQLQVSRSIPLQDQVAGSIPVSNLAAASSLPSSPTLTARTRPLSRSGSRSGSSSGSLPSSPSFSLRSKIQSPRKSVGQRARTDAKPFLAIVLIILFSLSVLSVGRITSALVASVAWFTFSAFRK